MATREPENDPRPQRATLRGIRERDSADAPPFSAEERLPAALGPLLVFAGFCALAAWSWGKWTDVQIDFGNELYIPWQITEGKALYRDMAHRNGPLSHYVNAGWFSLFGVSVRTLVFCNLAILLAVTAMTWAVFVRSCGRLTATVACGVLLGVFSFSQYVVIANYNYVTPYHHHQTHGIALTLGMMLAIAQALGTRSARWLGLAGAALGGVFLTKTELFVPAAMAAAVGLAGVLPLVSQPRAKALAFGAGFTAPVLLFFGALAAQMPAGLALEGLLGNWVHLGTGLGAGEGGGLLSDAFYRRGAGLDAPLENLEAMGLALLNLLGFVVVALLIDRDVPLSRRPAVALVLAVGAWAGMQQLMAEPEWGSLARVLPGVAAIGAWLLVRRCWRERRDRDFLARWGVLALWAVWSLGMLAKMGLAPRIHQYGFALAMPATLLLVAGLVHGLPRVAARRWQGGGLLRALSVAALVAAVTAFWGASDRHYQLNELVVGAGPDRIWTAKPPFSTRGGRIFRTLAYLEEQMGPEDTLLVYPEGISINYWLRKENPSRFHLFLPTELDAFGREAVLADLQRSAPDWVVLADRKHGEFGVGPFGQDPANGRAIVAWIREGYELVHSVGKRPFAGGRFGLQVWRRADHSSR